MTYPPPSPDPTTKDKHQRALDDLAAFRIYLDKLDDREAGELFYKMFDSWSCYAGALRNDMRKLEAELAYARLHRTKAA